MELHHSKHHQAYVTGLNTAEEAYAKAPSPKEQIKLQAALKFNGGGHINHSLFWKNLAPQGQGGGELAAGPLKTALEADFGSVDGEFLSLVCVFWCRYMLLWSGVALPICPRELSGVEGLHDSRP